METFRKIKIFKFSDYESYEDCQEAANDYWTQISKAFLPKKVFPDVNLNTDYIAILMPYTDGIKYTIIDNIHKLEGNN